MRPILYPDLGDRSPCIRYLGLLTELSCDIIYNIIIEFVCLRIVGRGGKRRQHRRFPRAANTLAQPGCHCMNSSGGRLVCLQLYDR